MQKGRGTQNYRKQQTAGNAGRRKLGGAKITANRLKNKQGSLQKVTVWKKIEMLITYSLVQIQNVYLGIVDLNTVNFDEWC